MALDAQEAIDLAPRAFGQSDLFAWCEPFKLELDTLWRTIAEILRANLNSFPRLAKTAAPAAILAHGEGFA